MCGKSISETSYVSENEGLFCCENCYLDYMLQQRSRHERYAMQMALGEALAAALDARESETGMHSKRVACHTQVLARHVSQDEVWLQQVYWGSLLHDIGKIAIPDTILLKEGALTEEEWSVMRSHPQRGYDIVATVPFMSVAADIILTHEERYDGSGYPQGFSGDDIPWGARLFAIIDTLDAMTSDRPYRRGMSFDASKEEILRMSGSQFDPKAVEVFVAEEAALREMVDMKCAVASGYYQPQVKHGSVSKSV
jgi:HD-GYP domain-containing protein (c-di-GMP phosphodiesterase class II)